MAQDSFGEKNLKVISLAPATTEILFALGLDEEIVAVSQYCNYPDKTLRKEKVGTFSNPNIEKILSLAPDMIFCTGLEQDEAVAKLRSVNLKVYVSDPANLEELFGSIDEIGSLVNRKKVASALIDSMKKRIEKIRLLSEGAAENLKPKVFIEIWHSPLMTAGNGSFIDELISAAGGVNIGHDVRRPYSYFSPEQVIKRNPDCIILTYMAKENPVNIVRDRFGWGDISAVKNGRVYNDINPDILLRPGPRLVEGLEELYKRLHS